jgi:sec-independent protein translocase protein TatA
MIGSQDLLILLGIGILVFGAKRLPELARSIGQSMKEFKKGVSNAADDESSKPEAPVPQPTLSPVCASCQTALQAEWAHCPKCGAAVPTRSIPGPLS